MSRETSVAEALELRAHGDDGARVGNVVFEWVRQAVCGMHGHENLLQFAQDRMFLKCVSCGHESPGWEITEPRPVVKEHGEASRHPLQRQQLVGARRVA